MSAFCQYVPYTLAEGDWDSRRDELADRVETSIERFAPGFRDLVVEREALGPPDVERKIGLTGGHIFQGECLPEHMWDRRLPYRTGAEGVYLCGAGTHPGGSVIAANGRNAALAVLRISADAGRLREPNSLQQSGKRGTHMVVQGRIPGWCPGSASSASPSANPVGNAHERLGVAHSGEIPAYCRIRCMLHKRVPAAGDRGQRRPRVARRMRSSRIGLLVRGGTAPARPLGGAARALGPARRARARPRSARRSTRSASRSSAKKGRERVLSSTVARYSKRIGSLQGDITVLQRKQIAIQGDLDAKRAELARIQEDLRQERIRLARLRARLAEARIALAGRLVELYKADKPDVVTVVLESDGFADLLERTEFMQRVSDQDARIIDRVRTARADAKRTAERLDMLEERQTKVAAAIEARRDAVARVKGQLVDRRDAFAPVRSDKSTALASTRDDRQHLEGDLAALERENAESRPSSPAPRTARRRAPPARSAPAPAG